MDDLTGLDWSSTSSNASKKPPPMNSSSAFYPALRPTPSPATSGRNTPLSNQGSGNIGAKPPTQKPAQDSFSNLVNFGSAKSNANLSLKEQQERLEAEKRRKEEEKRKLAATHYGDGKFWDTLGQRQTASPQLAPPAPAANTPIAPSVGNASRTQSAKPADPDEDLFAAFNASTKVDNASHYPPPPSKSARASPAANPGLDLSNPSAWNKPTPQNGGSGGGGLGDDDDPFGLNELKPNTRTPEAIGGDAEDDDFLGDLGKPVEAVRRQRPPISREPEPGKAIEDSSSDSSDDEVEEPRRTNDPFDRAVAQLVDYGFTPENARRGLTESGAGLNVQAAANWLLDDAHRQAKEKARGKNAPGALEPGDSRGSSRSRPAGPDGPRPRDGRSPHPSGDDDDVDFAKTAAAMGSNFLKTAGSLWKTGQKKVQKAVAELQQEGDPNQPKWMRSAQQDMMDNGGRGGRAEATDEAMMLDSGMRPGRTQPRPNVAERQQRVSNPSSRDRSPATLGTLPNRGSPVPRWQQNSSPSLPDPRSRLNKQAVEEESAQAYVSPARRKKPSPQPSRESSSRPAEPEPDLLFNPTATAAPKQPPRQTRPSPPRPVAKPRPARQIPSLSASALETSTRHRLSGTAHFKRGDYAAAHADYTTSLTAVPQTHPLAILLLCNRALTALKTGEPRQAVADADTALGLIGEGKGEGEAVELGGAGNEKRDMRDLYGKALTRKAEALEQMEKWSDAGAVWQLCVESGVGGPTAIAGRQRCQKALAPKPAAAPRPKPKAAAAPSRPRPRPTTRAADQKSSDAVERLRAANQAAEREGDEKFALADKVDAKIAAWRDGKRDNLRALLSSLDNVLWEGSGWKKVGLHELVMANKVKIVYMKAIAKTHPDKIAQDATTEVRMIAGTVFSTLNEAWDKFKAENGL